MFEVMAMSAEKLPFILPAVFTIGQCSWTRVSFSYLGQKIQMEAANQAKIDVSEVKMKKKKLVEAIFYEKENEAEAQKATTEATFYARQQVADCELYAKQKEAEGLVALAQGTYIRTLLGAWGVTMGL
ncbi:putative Flotillin family [Helianthus annuus]|nr:putative Flotillin family [Helianthus annuus]